VRIPSRVSPHAQLQTWRHAFGIVRAVTGNETRVGSHASCSAECDARARDTDRRPNAYDESARCHPAHTARDDWY